MKVRRLSLNNLRMGKMGHCPICWPNAAHVEKTEHHSTAPGRSGTRTNGYERQKIVRNPSRQGGGRTVTHTSNGADAHGRLRTPTGREVRPIILTRVQACPSESH